MARLAAQLLLLCAVLGLATGQDLAYVTRRFNGQGGVSGTKVAELFERAVRPPDGQHVYICGPKTTVGGGIVVFSTPPSASAADWDFVTLYSRELPGWSDLDGTTFVAMDFIDDENAVLVDDSYSVMYLSRDPASGLLTVRARADAPGFHQSRPLGWERRVRVNPYLRTEVWLIDSKQGWVRTHWDGSELVDPDVYDVKDDVHQTYSANMWLQQRSNNLGSGWVERGRGADDVVWSPDGAHRYLVHTRVRVYLFIPKVHHGFTVYANATGPLGAPLVPAWGVSSNPEFMDSIFATSSNYLWSRDGTALYITGGNNVELMQVRRDPSTGVLSLGWQHVFPIRGDVTQWSTYATMSAMVQHPLHPDVAIVTVYRACRQTFIMFNTTVAASAAGPAHWFVDAAYDASQVHPVDETGKCLAVGGLAQATLPSTQGPLLLALDGGVRLYSLIEQAANLTGQPVLQRFFEEGQGSEIQGLVAVTSVAYDPVSDRVYVACQTSSVVLQFHLGSAARDSADSIPGDSMLQVERTYTTAQDAVPSSPWLTIAPTARLLLLGGGSDNNVAGAGILRYTIAADGSLALRDRADGRGLANEASAGHTYSLAAHDSGECVAASVFSVDWHTANGEAYAEQLTAPTGLLWYASLLLAGPHRAFGASGPGEFRAKTGRLSAGDMLANDMLYCTECVSDAGTWDCIDAAATTAATTYLDNTVCNRTQALALQLPDREPLPLPGCQCPGNSTRTPAITRGPAFWADDLLLDVVQSPQHHRFAVTVLSGQSCLDPDWFADASLQANDTQSYRQLDTELTRLTRSTSRSRGRVATHATASGEYRGAGISPIFGIVDADQAMSTITDIVWNAWSHVAYASALDAVWILSLDPLTGDINWFGGASDLPGMHGGPALVSLRTLPGFNPDVVLNFYSVTKVALSPTYQRLYLVRGDIHRGALFVFDVALDGRIEYQQTLISGTSDGHGFHAPAAITVARHGTVAAVERVVVATSTGSVALFEETEALPPKTPLLFVLAVVLGSVLAVSMLAALLYRTIVRNRNADVGDDVLSPEFDAFKPGAGAIADDSSRQARYRSAGKLRKPRA